MLDHVLVLDFGKTHARAFVIDRAGVIVASERTAFAAPSPSPYRHLPVGDMLAFAERLVAMAAAQYGSIAVIPATHGAAIALLDDNGLVLPVLDYEDPGPESEPDYDKDRPPFAETFSPALPLGLNLGRQLAWLERNFPIEFARATSFLTLPQFIGWHLTGQKASEATSLGCHSDLWAPLGHDYSSLVDVRGWRNRFPPLQAAGDEIGPLRSELADRLGIAAPVMVLNGLHDSNASLVAHLSAVNELTLVSTGTWFIVMAVGGSVDPALPAARDCLANVDVRGRPYPCARFMGGREYAALADGREATLDDVPLIARAVADGRMILPSHAGGGPFPSVAGSVPDAWPDDERAALASLYLALMTAKCAGLIAARGPIMIEGPAAANPLYGAILQALFPERPVAAAIDTDATARGAALLALGSGGAPAAVPAARIEIAGLADYAHAWTAAAEARVIG